MELCLTRKIYAILCQQKCKNKWDLILKRLINPVPCVMIARTTIGLKESSFSSSMVFPCRTRYLSFCRPWQISKDTWSLIPCDKMWLKPIPIALPSALTCCCHPDTKRVIWCYGKSTMPGWNLRIRLGPLPNKSNQHEISRESKGEIKCLP